MHASPSRPKTFGVMAEFLTPEQLIAAANKVREAGFKNIDAYSPFPIHGIDDALGIKPTKLPLLILLGGIAGLVLGFLLQHWTTAIDYPINIGGRPLLSLPSFIPVMFECTVLFAAFTAVIGMIALNRLPMPYHPVFNVPEFRSRASIDRFFLCIEFSDAQFEKGESFLKGLNANAVYEVHS